MIIPEKPLHIQKRCPFGCERNERAIMVPSPSSSPPAVTVVEQCHVSPAPGGLPDPLGEVSLPLTFFDIFWVLGHPVERLFFYRWPDLTIPNFVASALPRLKRSLSLVLRYYYPLAGRLIPPPPGSSPDKFHILCTNSDSVPFTLAECDGDYFHLLSGDHARCVQIFRPLIPEMPAASDGSGSLALMALQVTVFPGAGLCVGVSIQHIACDGSGFTSFLKTWGAACRSEGEVVPPAGEVPVIDRTLVSDPKGLYAVCYDFIKSVSIFENMSLSKADGPVVEHSTFLLKRAHIEELRNRVSEQRPLPHRYSSFVLTCAYVWVCLLKAMEQPPPQGVRDAAYVMFAVDFRRRLQPPLPAAYFGNCIGLCFVDARRSDLLESGGVAPAAEAIAKSVADLGADGGVPRGADEWNSRIAACLPGRPLSIAGSPRFGVYGVDFGWGRPAKVEIVGLEKTGAISLAESREGDGGIEVGVALPAPEMAKFQLLFPEGLEDNDTEARK